VHGLLLKVSDIAICRTPDGRKCRLGEGGFGVVYKAMMNNVDEVAVKLAKVRGGGGWGLQARCRSGQGGLVQPRWGRAAGCHHA
jgi:hypothetical protein